MQSLKRELSIAFKQHKSGGGQRGVALYLSLMIMTILLAITLGLGAIFIGQVRVMRRMGNSVIAFHAANTGVEKVLVDRRSPNLTPDFYSGSLVGGATYKVVVTRGRTVNCVAPNFCIKSIGVYQETRRAIKISY